MPKPEPEASEENLKVAVRVRPFNKRELGRNAQLIVEMSGQTTIITNPNDSNEAKKFAFDYSYWSFDGFVEESSGYCAPDPGHKNGRKFCDQKKVFKDVGQGILDNAWQGFNTSLFAYGQTGSGKSWSIIGYGANKGVVPMLCEELFKGIKEKSGSGTTFEVKFSMLEIYNEVARDLLCAKGSKKGLKIRQHPKKGFYADGLKEAMVSSYEDITAKMEEGTVNRTVASTNMNATSSRAHTIVGINFIQKAKNDAGKEMAKSAIINLVDLAGSERVESTGATGERLKEGAGINKSLSCLGNVIHALAEQSEGKKTKVPYRDSVLTKLLQNALGGNSKTIMIAAISPADINFDESLSTLRYADRAKQIKTKASVNEDPTEALIRDLKEQNEKLLKQLANGQFPVNTTGMSQDEIQKMKKEWEEEMNANLQDNENQMVQMKLTYEEKLRIANEARDPHLEKIQKQRKSCPHLYNLNYDPQLNARVIHILEKTKQEVGNHKGEPSDIVMTGPGIHTAHAFIMMNGKDKKPTLRPCDKDCRILVNGSPITGDTDLDHNDRIVFGSTQIWVFQNPLEKGSKKKIYPPISYEYAQEEIAAKAGINMDHAGSSDVALLQEDLIDVMPAVEEANSISEELDKRVKFEIVLISQQMLGKMNMRSEGFEGRSKVSTQPECCVKMRNLENGTEFIWPKEKFMNRLYLMKEMYENFEEEEDDWDKPPEHDPFKEDINKDVTIGTVEIYLQPIAYLVEMKEQLELTDLKGNKVGIINIEVCPCDKNGREYSEKDDKFVDDPTELIKKELNFVFKIVNCRGIPNKYRDVHCSYNIHLEEKGAHKTEKISLTANPDFNHKHVFTFNPVTHLLLDYLKEDKVTVTLLGKHHVRKSAVASKKGMSTKDLVKQDRGGVFNKTANLMNGFQMNGRVVDPQKQSVIVELLLMKKTQARLQQKIDNMKKMLERAERLKRQRISTGVIRSMMAANTDDQVATAMRQLEADVDDDDSAPRGMAPPPQMPGGAPNPAAQAENSSSGACVLL